jgi:bacterioferritin-associated ferredoxin
MKQRHEQRQQFNFDEQTSNEQTALVRQEAMQLPTTPTFADLAKTRIINKYNMTEQSWVIYDAAMSIGLLTLRTAYPTQARNYSDKEHDMLAALWLEIFAEVKPDILYEAIMRFISTDRKGFFPSPGQVMGIVESIVKEREWKETEKRIAEHAIYLRELQKRIDGGENCSTCLFCEHREVVDKWDSRKKEKNESEGVTSEGD